MASTKIQLKSLTNEPLYPIIDITNFALDGVKQTGTLATQTWVNETIAAHQHLKRSIVTSLPAVADADALTIYMVKRTDATGQIANDIYDEYLLIDGAFELLGNTVVDFTDINAAIDEKQDILTAGDYIDITSNTISATISAGTNIEITGAGVISAKDTTYTAGDGLDLDGTVFSLLPATSASMGGVIPGANIDVDETDGTISVADASSTVKGVVQISGGTLGTGATTAATEYAVRQYISDALTGDLDIDIAIPDATKIAKGVVQIGANINVASGTISVNTANSTTLGVVKVGIDTLATTPVSGVAATEKAVKTYVDGVAAGKQDTLTQGANIVINSGGTISAVDTTYTDGDGIILDGTEISLDVATYTTIGGVVVGDNISVDADGLISVADATSTVKGVVQISGGTLGTSATVAATEAAVKAYVDGVADDKQDTLTAGASINISGSTISVTNASSTAKGAVQISGGTLGTSATVAATEAAVQDAIAGFITYETL